MKIELTGIERGLIESALNHYWNDAHNLLDNKGVVMSDDIKRPLGDIEKTQLEVRITLIKPLLDKFY